MAFRDQAKRLEPEAIEDQLLDQIHEVSRIASMKMRRVRWAYLVSGPAIVVWVVVLAWGSA